MLSKRPVVFTAFVLLVGLFALTCANDDEKLKKYEKSFAACEKRCELFSKEECPSRVEKCQFLARSEVYNDCMDEEEVCVNKGETDCYKAFLTCIKDHAKD
nr:hypothetical protein HmN_000620100 [Hymenolepis microstoma]